jgi:methyltransferase family protein
MPLRRAKRRVLLELNLPTDFSKTDLIHLISRKLKLSNYLELCTRSTGNYYKEIDRMRFRTARRLMYNCPTNFDDSLPIDFRISDFDISPAIKELKTCFNRVDICLVDGWHTYDCAIRDLTCVYDLLADGGVMIVHDCMPENERTASPAWISGNWCGVSYRAYLDFVLSRHDLDYCTVNVDHGCGIIFKKRSINVVNDLPSRAAKSKLIANWFSVHDDNKAAYSFFIRHHVDLLRLVSARDFTRALGRRAIQRSGELAIPRPQ